MIRDPKTFKLSVTAPENIADEVSAGLTEFAEDMWGDDVKVEVAPD